jgi:hypothetical protein
VTPLEQYPQARKVLYTIQWTVSGAMLLLGVTFAALDSGVPEWYAVTSAVLSALWAYTGVTAAQNVPSPVVPTQGVPYKNPDGPDDPYIGYPSGRQDL